MTHSEVRERHTVALRLGDRKESGLWRRFRFFLQDHPTPLVWVWNVAEMVLKILGGIVERVGVKRSSR